jgi:hypothetical protein
MREAIAVPKLGNRLSRRDESASAAPAMPTHLQLTMEFLTRAPIASRQLHRREQAAEGLLVQEM